MGDLRYLTGYIRVIETRRPGRHHESGPKNTFRRKQNRSDAGPTATVRDRQPNPSWRSLVSLRDSASDSFGLCLLLVLAAVRPPGCRASTGLDGAGGAARFQGDFLHPSGAAPGLGQRHHPVHPRRSRILPLVNVSVLFRTARSTQPASARLAGLTARAMRTGGAGTLRGDEIDDALKPRYIPRR